MHPVAAAWYRARSELRSRGRAALLLVVLVGIVGGVVLTTVAGARRSSTAYERFRRETLASDLDVAFDGPPDGSIEEAAAAVRALPQVAALRRLDFPFIVPAGSGFYPYLDFLAAVDPDGLDEREVDRPRVLDGRLPDPRRADQMAITETYARESGLGVGDRAEFESYAPQQLEPLFTGGGGGPPAGPRVTFLVTGVLDAPTFLSESSGDFQPRAFLSPAFVRAHGDEVATYPGGFSLRLHGGAPAAREVTETLRAMYPDQPLEITPASEVDRKIDSGIDVIVAALVLFALVAAAAGTVAIGQALSRTFAEELESNRSLRALGMTRAERVISQSATTVPVAVVGAVVAAGASVLASPLLPIGIARRAEPDPGFAVDTTVLAVGFVGMVVTVQLLSVLAATATAGRARAADPTSAANPSRAMSALRRTSLGPSVTAGVGMALDPRGGTRVAVRSAFLAVALGAAGLVAGLVFVESVDTLVHSPARYGSPFDAAVSGFSGDVLGGTDVDLLEDPRAARVGLGYGGLARIGDEEVNTYALEPLKGDMALTMLRGRAPTSDAEVALGAITLESADVALGDEVVVDGQGGTLRATVVGTAVFPVTDERSAPGRGVLLGRDDLEAISSPDELNADVLIDWAADVEPRRANEALATATGTEVFGPRLPSDVNNLREVRALPGGLAAFLVLLATVAVVHALVSTVRVRRHELAVLRALGFRSRQLRSTVLWEAITIALVGIAVGVPLGVAVGRGSWGAVARGVGVVESAVIPGVSIQLGLLGAMVVIAAGSVAASRPARKVSATTALRAGG